MMSVKAMDHPFLDKQLERLLNTHSPNQRKFLPLLLIPLLETGGANK
jgi:hypothetical protein